MFGGKTTELIRILETSSYVSKCLYINHIFDSRSSEPFSTHSQAISPDLASKLNVVMIQRKTLGEIPDSFLADFSVVCIDEAQFFEDLPEAVNKMVDVFGLEVYVAGLNGDYRRQPFGRIHELIPVADDIRFLSDTFCHFCAKLGQKRKALFTLRRTNTSAQIDIGSDQYAAVCRSCYLSFASTYPLPPRSDAEKVRLFTEEACGKSVPCYPEVMNLDEVRFITKMVCSELLELVETVTDDPVAFLHDAVSNADKHNSSYEGTGERIIADQADAMVDMWYYMLNAAAKKGVNLSKIFDVVHTANMAKRFPDGEFHRREDGKIIKPPNWKEPDIEAEIKTQREKGAWA